MAAGTRPAAGPRSRAAMAQWRKKKGLRKRRGAASQARSSDSEDGEFEIQAEDDARAQKVGARGRDTLWSPSPSPPHRPALGFPQRGKWSQLRVGRGRLAGGRGQGRRREHVRPCPSRRGSRWPRAFAFRGPGPAGPSWPAFGRARLIGYFSPRGRVLAPFGPMKSAGAEAPTWRVCGILVRLN